MEPTTPKKEEMDPTLDGYLRDLHGRATRASAYGEPEMVTHLTQLVNALPRDIEGFRIAPGFVVSLEDENGEGFLAKVLAVGPGEYLTVRTPVGLEKQVHGRDALIKDRPGRNEVAEPQPTTTGKATNAEQFRVDLAKIAESAADVAGMLERLTGQYTTSHGVHLAEVAATLRSSAKQFSEIARIDNRVIENHSVDRPEAAEAKAPPAPSPIIDIADGLNIAADRLEKYLASRDAFAPLDERIAEAITGIRATATALSIHAQRIARRNEFVVRVNWATAMEIEEAKKRAKSAAAGGMWATMGSLTDV